MADSDFIEQGATNPGYYCLAFTALIGVVISMYYYFGVVRAIYFSKETADAPPITMSLPAKLVIVICLAGMVYLGLFPTKMLNLANDATAALGLIAR